MYHVSPLFYKVAVLKIKEIVVVHDMFSFCISLKRFMNKLNYVIIISKMQV